MIHRIQPSGRVRLFMKHVVFLTAAMVVALVATPALASDSGPFSFLQDEGSATAPTQDAAPAEPAAEAPAPTDTASAEAAPKKDSAVPDAVAVLTGGTASQERFGGAFSFSQSLGLGSFVMDKFARQPYYGWSINLAPRVFLYKDLWLSMSFSMSGELSQSFTSNNTYPRVFMPSDLFVSLKYKYVIPKIKVNFSPFIRIGAPTSAESRARDLYLSTGIGFDLNRMFGKHVLLGYSFRYNKNWNGSTSTVIPRYASLIRLNGAEDAGGGQAYGGGLTSEMSIMNRLMASFIINDQWSISVVLGISNAWTYKGALPSERDEFTNENAKPGRGQSDSTSGVIDISYQPWEHVGFSIGMSSSQPAFTADNKSLRFPFFDFTSEGNNFTQFYFDVNVNY